MLAVKWGLYLGSLVAAFALGLSLGAHNWRHGSGPRYAQARTTHVLAALSLADPVDTLVLGDSISESTWLDGVCGKTFNASVAGAKIADVAALAPIAIQQTRPKVVVLEVGTNNMWTDPKPSDDFKQQYFALLRSLPGEKILVGVPNSPAASRFVRSVASSIDAAYVQPVTGELTRDGGVHPNREGAAVYRQRIQEACRHAVAVRLLPVRPSERRQPTARGA